MYLYKCTRKNPALQDSPPAARVFDHMEYKDTMQEIYKVMVEQNENAFSGVKKIAEYIKKQYNYKLTIDEQLYLLIHIKRILDEQTK